VNKFKAGDAVTLNGEVGVVIDVFCGPETMSLYLHEYLFRYTVSPKKWKYYTGPFVRGEKLVWQGDEVEYIAPGVESYSCVITKDGKAGFAPTHNLARRKRTRKVTMQAYIFFDGRIVCYSAQECLPDTATTVGEPFEIEVPE
jgi:hypothetical protein